MRLLLDTHVWLWLNLDPARLPLAYSGAIGAPNNDLVISVASIWETSIKAALGKLIQGEPFADFLAGARP